jgi:hypothetical protein
MENNTCSICLEEVQNNITVCQCKNPVHISCLIEWLHHKDNTICEICNTQYNIQQNILTEYINIPELNDNNISDLEENNSPNFPYNENNIIYDIYYNYINRRIFNNNFCRYFVLPIFIGGFIFCMFYLCYLLYINSQHSKYNK